MYRRIQWKLGVALVRLLSRRKGIHGGKSVVFRHGGIASKAIKRQPRSQCEPWGEEQRERGKKEEEKPQRMQQAMQRLVSSRDGKECSLTMVTTLSYRPSRVSRGDKLKRHSALPSHANTMLTLDATRQHMNDFAFRLSTEHPGERGE